MKITETKCRTALSKSRLPGLDYSLNPYYGCQHKCAYCYVPNVMKIPRERWGSFVDVKKNIPVVLSKELKNKQSGVVGISTVTDPYQSVEKKYRLTRYCLEQLLIHNFPICIQSKSDLILRDRDIISRFSDIEIMMSIGTIDDSERKVLEPYSSSIQERLDALKKFSSIGIKTSVFFGPIYPTVEKEKLTEIVDKFKDTGIDEIMIDRLNLKPGIFNNIKNTLQQKKYIMPEFFSDSINNKDNYNKLRKYLFKLGEKRNIKIIDAF